MWLCYVDKSILKASTLYITAPSSMWPHLFASLHMTVYRNAKCWSVSIFSFLSFSTAQSLCHRNWTESRLEWGRDDERYFRDQVLHLFHSVYDYYKLSILKNNHIVPLYSIFLFSTCANEMQNIILWKQCSAQFLSFGPMRLILFFGHQMDKA